MVSSYRIDIFAEDRSHEAFIAPIVYRLAREHRKNVEVKIRSAIGGHGRVQTELKLYQQNVRKALIETVVPDIIVVAIDANCNRWNNAKKGIEDNIEQDFKDKVVIACPDPHIECWYFADIETFKQIVGIQPRRGKKKCKRDKYKSILAKAVIDAGYPPTLGGVEFAKELAENMDFFRAGKQEKSLGNFLDNLRAKIKSLP